MTKTELIQEIARRTGQTQAEAARMLNAFTDIVGDTLADGQKVRITGFGTFDVQNLPPRTARNPRTGEQIKVDARRKPRFKAGADLSSKVN